MKEDELEREEPRPVFLRHLSRDPALAEEAPKVVTEHEVITSGEFPDWPALLFRGEKFKESGNPIHAIESIILCHEAGLYPPLHVLDWLADALNKWHASVQLNKDFTMERAMGLKGEKGGKSANAMRNAVLEQFEESLMIEMNRLIHTFALTPTDSACMVSERLENTDWNHLDMPLPKYSLGHLRDTFAKWRPMFECETGEEPRRKREAAPHEEKLELLSHYPRHAWMHIESLKPFL